MTENLLVKIHVTGSRGTVDRAVARLRAAFDVQFVSEWQPNKNMATKGIGYQVVDVLMDSTEPGQHSGRGVCTGCGLEYSVRRSDGATRAHQAYNGDGRKVNCPGSGRPPKPGSLLPVHGRRLELVTQINQGGVR